VSLRDKTTDAVIQKPTEWIISNWLTGNQQLMEPLQPLGSKAPRPGATELSPSPSSQQPINTIGDSGEGGKAGIPPLTKQEKKEVWKYRAKLLGGLVLPFFLNSIDVTIIATALPHIADDFGMYIFPLVILNH